MKISMDARGFAKLNETVLAVGTSGTISIDEDSALFRVHDDGLSECSIRVLSGWGGQNTIKGDQGETVALDFTELARAMEGAKIRRGNYVTLETQNGSIKVDTEGVNTKIRALDQYEAPEEIASPEQYVGFKMFGSDFRRIMKVAALVNCEEIGVALDNKSDGKLSGEGIWFVSNEINERYEYRHPIEADTWKGEKVEAGFAVEPLVNVSTNMRAENVDVRLGRVLAIKFRLGENVIVSYLQRERSAGEEISCVAESSRTETEVPSAAMTIEAPSRGRGKNRRSEAVPATAVDNEKINLMGDLGAIS